ncbi:hypothetical protein C9374_007831 [Naegleria lovaniensis]|uniref:folate gamma-glutamyl hydrolase n=1 Tax=Naegleria lovaniensis TaxID=51637 RepID=A0AA88GM17_NAELO|nr:uncharacterized protein C9374_007831 [Naegleria lovaniensis]KAG2378683.1 hypothetical protein C9374_007831 [Naegleria lovaniensis]
MKNKVIVTPLVFIISSIIFFINFHHGLNTAVMVQAFQHDQQDFGTTTAAAMMNTRPIIGILAQPTLSGKISRFGKYYIDAAYVKFVESSGARVVPIRFDLPVHQLREYFEQINGLLLPGGAIDLVDNSTHEFTPYLVSQQLFVNWAIEAFHSRQDYFPIWGTCLGMQSLSLILANDPSVMESGFDSENMAIPLDFTMNNQELLYNTRMFSLEYAPLGDMLNLIQTLRTKNVTFNAHKDGIPMDNWLGNEQLRKHVKLLSTNLDRNGRKYASLFEHESYPIYASQFHPEKAIFEWNTEEVINHSYESVTTNTFFGRFFVNECRKNFHRFKSSQAEDAALIYHYTPVYTYELVQDFEQCYFI